jgi:hypothetical protein
MIFTGMKNLGKTAGEKLASLAVSGESIGELRPHM